MKLKIRRSDLGDDVLYAVGESPTLTLLVLNTRPVSALTGQHAAAVRKLRDEGGG